MEMPISLHECFESWVLKTPDAPALAYKTQVLTYSELNSKSNQFARYLLSRGVQQNDRVAMCLDRSVELMVVILAILKVGACYVPIDPNRPEIHIQNILDDAKPKLTVVDQETAKKIHQGELLNISLERADIEKELQDGLSIDKSEVDLCYIIYTSGTTGRPNGVCISHQNILNLMKAGDLVYHFKPEDVWTLFHSYAFDFSVWEIWGALAFGGKLVIVPSDIARMPKDFYRLLSDEGVTVLNQTPSAFYQLIYFLDGQENPPPLNLRIVIFGGEGLDFSRLAPWFSRFGDQKPMLYNMYGITETTVHVTYYRVTEKDLLSNHSIIGKPLPSYEICLLDENNNVVPEGERGEICVLGPSLSPGYLNNSELTQARFISLNNRIYKSRDTGFYLPDGNLVYVGRIDHQVKIRGYRIELGEIESALKKYVGVKAAVVLVKNDVAEKKQLFAYIQQTVSNPFVSAKRLRDYLRGVLPDYMIPSRFYFVKDVPMTINGKIDKEALLRGEQTIKEKEISMEKLNENILEAMRKKLEELIEIDEVNVNENFYDVGGNSLLSFPFMSWVQEEYELDLNIKDLFEKSISEISKMAEINLKNKYQELTAVS